MGMQPEAHIDISWRVRTRAGSAAVVMSTTLDPASALAYPLSTCWLKRQVNGPVMSGG